MNSLALKKFLIDEIHLIDDNALLNELKGVIQRDKSLYKLSSYHIERLEESRNQIKSGHFFSQEEVDKILEKWQEEK
jgi:hypothetical protein